MGPIATAALKQLHLDVLFLGVHGMDADAGFTTPNLLEAETDRAFVAAARRMLSWPTTPSGAPGHQHHRRLEDADEVISDPAYPDAQGSSATAWARLRSLALAARNGRLSGSRRTAGSAAR